METDSLVNDSEAVLFPVWVVVTYIKVSCAWPVIGQLREMTWIQDCLKFASQYLCFVEVIYKKACSEGIHQCFGAP